MPSRTSKPKPSPRSPWKVARDCSEPELERIAGELASLLSPGSRVFLEGPLGAGKSTFARALLRRLGMEQPPAGSPTFAIAHEYEGPRGEVAHVDLYRLQSEGEIETAGIESYFWERPLIVLCEWASRFPDFARAAHDSASLPVLGRGLKPSIFFVTLMPGNAADTRDVDIQKGN